MDSTSYYNKHSQAFFDRTVHADVQDLYQRFLHYLPKQGRILDAGCGVGRDAKFFQSQGYEVVAFDASVEMVKMASHLLGKEVKHLRFEEIDFSSQFDAFWANASLLHVPYKDLRGVLQKFQRALRPSGILFASFKYGDAMRQVEERFFFDMNETKVLPYLEGLFKPLEIWKSADTRSQVAPSQERSWLNCIARRA